ncbi:Dual specificity protein phosphatase 22 [Sarcoptes scabiei]|uniref:Dual specificity protein phosphatase 22 n=1 Tax=Sarcoptes scabiei TaxID=52283 RepID=A0A834VE07_SARSC|nr:Dual specificity protein phosphatase 22 [Sarcoptes scabiei]
MKKRENMNKILDGLFIGNIRDSRNFEQLKANSITHMVSIHDDTALGSRIEGIKYLLIGITDSPHQNIIKFIPKCNDFIHSARLAGGNVLIHCLAGMSRSVSIVAGYLISVTSITINEALDAIRSVRSISAPNPGFYRQLLDFEIYRLNDERSRLSTSLALLQSSSSSTPTTTASTSTSISTPMMTILEANLLDLRQKDEKEVNYKFIRLLMISIVHRIIIIDSRL